MLTLAYVLLLPSSINVKINRPSSCTSAWLFPYCLSTKSTPEIVTFAVADQFGGIVNDDSGKKRAPVHTKADVKLRKIQCFPLYTVLMALGN
jgi:hypothetical protein